MAYIRSCEHAARQRVRPVRHRLKQTPTLPARGGRESRRVYSHKRNNNGRSKERFGSWHASNLAGKTRFLPGKWAESGRMETWSETQERGLNQQGAPNRNYKV